MRNRPIPYRIHPIYLEAGTTAGQRRKQVPLSPLDRVFRLHGISAILFLTCHLNIVLACGRATQTTFLSFFLHSSAERRGELDYRIRTTSNVNE